MPLAQTNSEPTYLCGKCLQNKPITEFHRHQVKVVQSWCKLCRKLYDIRKLDGGARAAYNMRTAELRRQKPDVVHGWRIKACYGITTAVYVALLKSQHGRCAICRALPNPKRRLDVDHDHKTNRVRGLLCYRCNRMLGFAQDSKQTLRKAVGYLCD